MSNTRHLPAQIRAYRAMDTTPRRPQERRWPQWVLIFDTETSTEYHQRFKFGGFRVATVRQNDDGTISARTVIEGLIYDDELPDFDPDGWRVLQEYMTDSAGKKRLADVALSASDYDDELRGEIPIEERSDLLLITRTEFVRKYIKDRGFTDILRPDREDEPCMIAGFNLAFDLSRLAIDATESRGDWDYGAISLKLAPDSKFIPRIILKRMGARGVDIHATRVGTEDHPPASESAPHSVFLDLSNLVFALTSRTHSLRSAGEAFGCKHLKSDAPEGHGQITPEYIEYNRQDVRATLDLWCKAMAAYLRHPIDLPANQAISSASIAKAYYRKMGIMGPIVRQNWAPRALLEGNGLPAKADFTHIAVARKAFDAAGMRYNGGQPKFDPRILARAMGAFFGGRSECRARMTMLPAVLLDFKSAYPTLVILFGIWEMLVSDRIDITPCDRAEVQAFLDSLTVDDLLHPETWHSHLTGFAEIIPDNDYLPYRSDYGRGYGQSPGIGINLVTGDRPLPYMLPDLAASKIHTGRAPRIIRAWKITKSDRLQPGLQPVCFNNNPELRIDPARDNLPKRIIELRQDAQNQHERYRDQLASIQAKDSETVWLLTQNGHIKGHDCPACVMWRDDALPGEPEYIPAPRDQHDAEVPCRYRAEQCYACDRYIIAEDALRYGLCEAGTEQRFKEEIRRSHASDEDSRPVWDKDTGKCRCPGCVDEHQLKNFANSGFYGVFAEMNIPRRARDNPQYGDVYGIDGQPWKRVRNPEEPGEFCFPPFAALITSGTRLMLAMAEVLVRDANGCHVFCDTDSLCVAASKLGGSVNGIPLLSYEQVESIRQRFDSLNPYDREVIKELLKWEHPKHEYLDSGREMYCVAISAKRYCLSYLDEDGNPVIARAEDGTGTEAEHDELRELSIEKRSEHGLGLYLNPLGDACKCRHAKAAHDQDGCRECECGSYRRYDWIAEVWRYIVSKQILNRDVPEPEWFGWPAAMRFTLSSWDMIRPLKRFDREKPFALRAGKPWNFGISFAPKKFPRALIPEMRLIAPFINDLSRYEHEPVFTVYNGKPVEARITTDPERTDDLIYHLDEVEQDHYPVIPVKTYREVVDSYVNHPERKYDDENGNPCTGDTRGRLYPTRIVISEYHHISKTGMEELTAEKTLQTDHYKVYANDGPERVRDLTKQILRNRYGRHNQGGIIPGTKAEADANTQPDPYAPHGRDEQGAPLAPYGYLGSGKPRRDPIIRTDLAELTPDWLTANLEAPPAEILEQIAPVRARNEQQVNGREVARELARRGIHAPVKTVYNFLDSRKTTMPRAKLFDGLVSLAREIALQDLNAASIHVPSRYTDSQIFSMWNYARKGK